MPDERERRLALNEAAFRVANERVHAWPERGHEPGLGAYYCECSNPDCRAQLQLTRAGYEHVRSSSRQFVLQPGHEVPDVETVVERGEGHVIVRKTPNVTPLVKGTDPRADP